MKDLASIVWKLTLPHGCNMIRQGAYSSRCTLRQRSWASDRSLLLTQASIPEPPYLEDSVGVAIWPFPVSGAVLLVYSTTLSPAGPQREALHHAGQRSSTPLESLPKDSLVAPVDQSLRKPLQLLQGSWICNQDAGINTCSLLSLSTKMIILITSS